MRDPHWDRVMSARAACRRAEWKARPAPKLEGNLIAHMTLACVSEKFVQIVAERRKQLFALRINWPTDNRVFVTYREVGGAEITRHLIKLYPREAAFSPAVAMARETLRAALNDLRKLDFFAEAATRVGGAEHA
jgi:hypothetical protein